MVDVDFSCLTSLSSAETIVDEKLFGTSIGERSSVRKSVWLPDEPDNLGGLSVPRSNFSRCVTTVVQRNACKKKISVYFWKCRRVFVVTFELYCTVWAQKDPTSQGNNQTCVMCHCLWITLWASYFMHLPPVDYLSQTWNLLKMSTLTYASYVLVASLQEELSGKELDAV